MELGGQGGTRLGLMAVLGLWGCAEDPGRGAFDGGGILTVGDDTGGAEGVASGAGQSDGGTLGSLDGGTLDDDGEGGDPGGEGDPKFDLSAGESGGPSCATECCPYEFSIIWIANDYQGTVSKIDTKTLVELGRYYTNATQGAGRPSRTSVNLLGDVAVTNRDPGSVTKIAAQLHNCVDTNANGTIETSSGAGDVLPWGTDECVLWHVPIDTEGFDSGPRPTAWEGGSAAADPCTTDQPRLWIGYKDDDNDAIFLRLDGATGAILDDVNAGFWSGDGDKGPYGGAVNADGDLVVTGKSDDEPAIRIDAESLEVDDLDVVGDSFEGGKYGMALDQQGNLWAASHHDDQGVHVYEFDDEQWTTIDGTGGTQLKGIAVDRDGSAWAAGVEPCRLVRLDVASRSVVDDNIALPGCSSPIGVSIDVDGFVWVVDHGANKAFKVNPSDYTTQQVEGLLGPYSYSDMTGAGLGLVVNPPG